MAAAHKTNDDADQAIHRMETVPPPAGEDDAYNATTKVGPMARGLVEAMMRKATADENSSVPPPASFTRGLSIPKAARLPALVAMPQNDPIQQLYSDAEEGDLFDPTALFGAPAGNPVVRGGAMRIENSGVLSILDELDGRRVSAPLSPTTELATLLEPVDRPLTPARRARPRRSTLAMEIAIFAGTFLLIAIPAAFAYLHWMR